MYSHSMDLQGIWQVSVNNGPLADAVVPGLVSDPKTFNTAVYSRKVVLPKGKWEKAFLRLNGARFCPAVSVNGEEVSRSEGGMTVTTHLLAHREVYPGNEILLSIALESLDHVSQEDASCIPAADRFRTNLSSLLWDAVTLSFYTEAAFSRVIPVLDFKKKELTVRFSFFEVTENSVVKAEILENNIPRLYAECSASQKSITLDVSSLKEWSPQSPSCYTLRLSCGESFFHVDESTFGIKDFHVEGKRFFLNGAPITLRAGSIVWHRLLRDPEMRELAFDAAWFEENIILRLKNLGANCIRFHLGAPPESFLALCDKHGILAQMEWSFFHGITATNKSILEQWRNFLTLSLRHPSAGVIHLWNETHGEDISKAFHVMEELSREFPSMVLSHRDVLHIHKYWWSMFENLGVSFESYEQFDQVIMVDEFGGNYLDGYCVPGGYPKLAEGFLRFLGRDHTPDLRLELQTEANAKIAEYWRRIGAAGFSPFCIFSSPEDGNHHFIGPVKYGIPKPVWKELTAAYAPVTASLALWNRNFTAGQTVTAPVHLINDTGKEQLVTVECCVTEEYSPRRMGNSIFVKESLSPYSKKIVKTSFVLPDQTGRFRLHCELVEPKQGLSEKVDSSWRVRTHKVCVPAHLQDKKIAVWNHHTEIDAFLRENHIEPCLEEMEASILMCPREAIACFSKDEEGRKKLASYLNKGISVVLLDIGERELGQGYYKDGMLGSLQASEKIHEINIKSDEVLKNVFVDFTLLAEPDSHFHPEAGHESLWSHLDKQSTWLWNGLKGGINVPAREMSVRGLSQKAFLTFWEMRGADRRKIAEQENYYCYTAGDYYEFSDEISKQVEDTLWEKLRFLAADAPSLSGVIKLNAKVERRNLAEEYRGQKGNISEIQTLALCGRGLSRTPLIQLKLENTPGKLVLSQLITQGRISREPLNPFYDTVYDPAAAQFVLNLIENLV